MIDVNLILVIALVASIITHLITWFLTYKLFQLVLRAISPSLRHPRPGGTEPMPPLSTWGSTSVKGNHRTDQLEGMVR